ncbi:hypothetical protein VTN00DRAFT_4953 [Thermoascus crustaceus]|uniref:uncharacterized protein n=1 Tax=Thermoascus crustaceus TaxID=5088 RepID=UPI0037444446
MKDRKIRSSKERTGRQGECRGPAAIRQNDRASKQPKPTGISSNLCDAQEAKRRCPRVGQDSGERPVGSIAQQELKRKGGPKPTHRLAPAVRQDTKYR